MKTQFIAPEEIHKLYNIQYSPILERKKFLYDRLMS